MPRTRILTSLAAVLTACGGGDVPWTEPADGVELEPGVGLEPVEDDGHEHASGEGTVEKEPPKLRAFDDDESGCAHDDPPTAELEAPPGYEPEPVGNPALRAVIEELEMSGTAARIELRPHAGLDFRAVRIAEELETAPAPLQESYAVGSTLTSAPPPDLVFVSTYVAEPVGLYDLLKVEALPLDAPAEVSLSLEPDELPPGLDAGERAASDADPLAEYDFPASMPPITYPEIVSCSGSDRDEAKAAWAMTHHHVWRMYQLMEFLGESTYRSEYWHDGFEDDEWNWSPRRWFGPYAGYRFDAIRRVVQKLWARVRTAEFDGIEIRLKCPPQSEVGNVCHTSSATAHHWVKGWVNICSKFFDEDKNIHSRAQTVVHELLHHAWVKWKKNGVWHLRAIQDTHTHGHGAICLKDLTTEKGYGVAKSTHLAYTSECYHQQIAMQNNDNYALNVRRLGSAVYRDVLTRFPLHPKKPGGGSGGGSGNSCSEAGGTSGDKEPNCTKIGQEWVCWGGGGPILHNGDCIQAP